LPDELPRFPWVIPGPEGYHLSEKIPPMNCPLAGWRASPALVQCRSLSLTFKVEKKKIILPKYQKKTAFHNLHSKTGLTIQ